MARKTEYPVLRRLASECAMAPRGESTRILRAGPGEAAELEDPGANWPGAVRTGGTESGRVKNAVRDLHLGSCGHATRTICEGDPTITGRPRPIAKNTTSERGCPGDDVDRPRPLPIALWQL